MKKIILLCTTILISISIFNQDYLPLLEENRKWSVMIVSFPGSWDTTYHTERLKIMGDSVISDQTYKRIYKSIENPPINWSFKCLVREDEEKKVWHLTYNSPPSEERLIYDFEAQVGDTIQMGHELTNYVIDSIKIVNIDDIDRKKFWISVPEEPDYHETWIEGLGSNKGVIYSASFGIVGGWTWLLCVAENDTLVYENPAYNDCYMVSTGINPETSEESIRVSPNPTSENISISNYNSIKILSLVLYDINGNKLNEFNPNLEYLDLSEYKSGIYILNIKTQERYFNYRIIKI